MKITVYLASGEGFDPNLARSVEEFGRWLGENRHELVFGGSKSGMMGRLAQSVLNAGGRVIGVEAKRFFDAGLYMEHLSELITCDTISARKQKMISLGEAFLAFPGGTGTLEEITEVMSLVSLGEISAPCVLFNRNGFYDDLKRLLDRMVSDGLSTEERLKSIRFASNLQDVVRFLTEEA